MRRLRLTIMGDRHTLTRVVTPCLIFKELGIHVSRAVPRAGFEPTFTRSELVVLPIDDLGMLPVDLAGFEPAPRWVRAMHAAATPQVSGVGPE